MPKASTSDIEVAQRACVLAGLAKVSSFDDHDSETAIALNDMYEDIVEDALTAHPWRFAIETVTLGPPMAVKPEVQFDAAYALPTDPLALQIRTLWVNGQLCPRYRIVGNTVELNANPTNAIELEALWRINEAMWPPWFRLYAVLRIASFLAGSLSRNGELASFLGDEAEKQLVRGRTRDSQQQTTQKLRLTKIRSSRLGGRPM